jgi:hypothetical protein
MLICHATQSAIRQNSTISYESTARIKTSETLANRSSSWFGHAIFVAVIAQSTLAVRHYKHEFECRTVSRVRSTSHAVRQTSFSRTPINPGTAQHSSDSSICISPSLMTDKFLTPSSTRFHTTTNYASRSGTLHRGLPPLHFNLLEHPGRLQLYKSYANTPSYISPQHVHSPLTAQSSHHNSFPDTNLQPRQKPATGSTFLPKPLALFICKVPHNQPSG